MMKNEMVLSAATAPQAITSMECAEMVGKRHNKLLADIRRYISQGNETKIGLVDFFTESTYQDAKGESRPCYLITKKGCEFIAHKLTGAKGTAFTAKYINRFHEMEEAVTALPEYDPQALNRLIALMESQSRRLAELEAKVTQNNMHSPFSESRFLTIQQTEARIKNLNRLADRAADLTELDKTTVLHYLYLHMQDNGIPVNSYKLSYEAETVKKGSSTLAAVAYWDKTYEFAVGVLEKLIQRKECFG